MVKLELTPDQAVELKNFYVIELKKLQTRVDEIKGLIEKLDPKTIINLPSATAERRVNTKKDISAVPQTDTPSNKEEKTKTPNMGSFVIQLLQEQNKALTKEQIFKLYQKHYNLKLNKSAAAYRTLGRTLSRLRVEKIIQSIKKAGTKDHLYSLTKWSDMKGTKTSPEKIAKAKKADSKPAKKISEKKVSEKRISPNVKYNWPTFVLDTLNKTKRILSAKDFVQHAMVTFNFSSKDNAIPKRNIPPTLSIMAGKSKLIKSIKKDGQSVNSFGLPNWFDDGKLLAVYK